VTATARLVVPALRWRDSTGFHHESAAIDDALAVGAGGFCIFGGTLAAVRELTAELRRRSAVPLLMAADLERGAGQQFDGATQLPPLAALGSLDDTTVTQQAAAITAAEALAAGVNWIFAPVADVDLEPRNPIVGTRAFGSDPGLVARHVAAWVQGCRTAGALCCAKHFPGHGRTLEDSHAALPRVPHDSAALESDLAPFRAAIDAGVDSLMTAHVVYDAWDDAAPATFSHAILSRLARRNLGFAGLVVSDALNMEGARRPAGGEGAAAVAALQAGCDALLYPDDVAAVMAALRDAAGHRVSAARCTDALRRVAAAAARGAAGRTAAAADVSGADAGRRADAARWADALAARTLVVCRGAPQAAGACDVAILSDDERDRYPAPACMPFITALRDAGVEAGEAGEARDDARAGGGRTVVALFSDVRAGKAAPGPGPGVRRALDELLARDADASVVLFGHPRLAQDLPGRHILAAWGGAAVMQRAAARRLTSLQTS
jgi:beta-glucosidase-like glycosyl hydrolase